MRWEFRNYQPVGDIPVPMRIRKTLYDPSSKHKTPEVYAALDYTRTGASLQALPNEDFDVRVLLDKEAEDKSTHITVDWDSGNKKVTFPYRKGESLEEQALAAASRQAKALPKIEEGRSGKRIYLGFGMLVALLAAAGWKGVTFRRVRRQ